MILFPAIDLIGGKAVRLYKGDYDQMTIYDDVPVNTALKFRAAGAQAIHLVDLEGARDGSMPNRDTVALIKKKTGLFCEVGGGIRSIESIGWYLQNGIDRVILGTAAVTDPFFAKQAAKLFPGKVAAGADIKDGKIAVKGWLEKSGLTAEAFMEQMLGFGIDTFIVTNISKDGAMQGTDTALYESLKKRFPDAKITASGGVSSMDDIRKLRAMDMYAAIIGKAYYTGAIDLKEALEAAK
ncbi:MAG: 1-(5-phosphoribosyl)-5-[(5-phosphoribosylamino)methylideneamino]imidazole-4-carboxamide isomerase [Clostridiales bacterium]|nr:1-(5-phosphoribosyl)-5-[(5-phosphoribosylamino)methylideneamino]imidazole-4-carboxamide isomerase [Clostridiales bacterium]